MTDTAGRRGAFRFPRAERLKKREDIRRVFAKGRKTSCKGAALFALANGLALHRIGFCFARKFGSAVQRNRARRLGREAYRGLRPRLTGASCCDIVLLMYPGVDTLAGRKAQLEVLLGRAGLL